MSVVWDERGGATVVRDGFPQSYVDPDDPLLLVSDVEQFAWSSRRCGGRAPLAVNQGGCRDELAGGSTGRTGQPADRQSSPTALTDLVRREPAAPRVPRSGSPVTGQEGAAALRDGSPRDCRRRYDEGRRPASSPADVGYGRGPCPRPAGAAATSTGRAARVARSPRLRNSCRTWGVWCGARWRKAVFGNVVVVQGPAAGDMSLTRVPRGRPSQRVAHQRGHPPFGARRRQFDGLV